MQDHVVRRAKLLLATTRHSAASLDEIRARAGSHAQVSWIYNGYDPDDFPPQAGTGSNESGLYRLAYVGTLWNLTSVAPLVQAVERLALDHADQVRRLELIFAGRRTPAQQALVDRLKQFPVRVVEHPYLEHVQALELLRSADGLCLLLSDCPGAERVVPAKVFEYLAARRRILAIMPRGECWELLAADADACRVLPGDIDGIAQALLAELSRPVGARREQGGTAKLHQYSRRYQAGQLADFLHRLVTLHPAP